MKNVGIRMTLLAGALSAGVLVAAPQAMAGTTLSVSRTAGVRAGQTVTVSLSGLPANLSSVAVGQCRARISGPGDCNLGGSLLGTADGRGVWHSNSSTAITLVGSIGGTDCHSAPGACTISVTSLTNPTNILASVPLTFG